MASLRGSDQGHGTRKSITFWATPEQLKRLNFDAEEADRTVSEYIRWKLFGRSRLPDEGE